METLRECPFCCKSVELHGGPEEWRPSFHDPDSGGNPYYISCECGCSMYTNTYDATEAIAAWNRRNDGWVSVGERLPEDDASIHKYKDGTMEMCSVLVCRKYASSDTEYVEIANRLNIPKTGREWLDKYATNGWEWSRKEVSVTHWRPLPEPPEV